MTFCSVLRGTQHHLAALAALGDTGEGRAHRALADHGGAALEGEIHAFMRYESMGSKTIVNVT
jgi:hypothetical protein